MTYDKTEMNAFVQNLYDQKMQEGKHGHYETMFHVVHAAIAAHTAKLLAGVEMPEPACDVSPYEVNHIYWNAGHEQAGCNSPLYTADQLLAYGDARDQAGYLRGLDEAKQACLQKHANGNWKHDTREECADAIEEMKGWTNDTNA